MTIRLLCIGKTTDKRISQLVLEYEKRISHYCKLKTEYLELKRKFTKENDLKLEEGKLILSSIADSSSLIILDELGKQFSSKGFAAFLQKQFNAGSKEIVFVIGGAYGFSEEVYQRANHKIALSYMTFTHQMVRLVFIEQIYRGLTILKGEKYHH